MDGWIRRRIDSIRGDAGGDEDRRDDGQAGQALGARRAQRERDTEGDSGQRVPAVVYQVGQQRQAAGEREHERLHRGGTCQDPERERDGPDALAGALDALVHETVRVTVRVLAVIVVRVLMAVMGAVFVRPDVRVGVAQRAVTVQVAFDEP